MRLVAIGENTQSVKKWNPKAETPDDEFVYIDIASVSQELKQVNGVSRLLGCDAPSRARQLVRAGDVVVSTVRPNLNAVAYIPEELDGATASTGFSVLRSDPNRLDPRYLYHWVRTQEFVSNMVKQATGQSYPAVSDKIVQHSGIPLPPIEEQKRIAAILDQSDALRRLRQRAIDRLNNLGQAIFHEMFGADFSEAKASAKHTIGDFCVVSSGSTPSRKRPEFYKGKIPWVKTTEVNGNVIHDTGEKVSEEATIASRLKTYPEETVLVAMYGQGRTRGQVGILGLPATTNQACAAIQCDEKLRPRFLFYQLKISYSRLRSLGQGGNQPNLNAGLVKSFPILVPPLAEQEKFTQRVSKIEGVAKSASSAVAAENQLFASLQYRAFQGEL